jgi:hypothetical protein
MLRRRGRFGFCSHLLSMFFLFFRFLVSAVAVTCVQLVLEEETFGGSTTGIFFSSYLALFESINY